MYTINIMRKIEKLMLEAIRDRREWKLDNTQVVCTVFTHGEHKIDRVNVILHGSTIAIITPTDVDCSDCGYQTPTTKSRLNALLRELCGASIYQKDRRWYGSAEGEQDWVIPRGSRQLFYRGEGN